MQVACAACYDSYGRDAYLRYRNLEPEIYAFVQFLQLHEKQSTLRMLSKRSYKHALNIGPLKNSLCRPCDYRETVLSQMKVLQCLSSCTTITTSARWPPPPTKFSSSADLFGQCSGADELKSQPNFLKADFLLPKGASGDDSLALQCSARAVQCSAAQRKSTSAHSALQSHCVHLQQPPAPPKPSSAPSRGLHSTHHAATRGPVSLHCTALHCTALHCTALHCTALH